MGEEKSEHSPMNIATISAGFEKGDFLVREEQGNRVYFDFFEEVRVRLQSDDVDGLHENICFSRVLLFCRLSITFRIKDMLVCREKMKRYERIISAIGRTKNL
jgi:hypothetical protein